MSSTGFYKSAGWSNYIWGCCANPQSSLFFRVLGKPPCPCAGGTRQSSNCCGVSKHLPLQPLLSSCNPWRSLCFWELPAAGDASYKVMQTGQNPLPLDWQTSKGVWEWTAGVHLTSSGWSTEGLHGPGCTFRPILNPWQASEPKWGKCCSLLCHYSLLPAIILMLILTTHVHSNKLGTRTRW